MQYQMRKENWFYCPTCDCVSYDYNCECLATYCNGGGCNKCRHISDLVEEAMKNKNHPDIQILKQMAEDHTAAPNKENQILDMLFNTNLCRKYLKSNLDC